MIPSLCLGLPALISPVPVMQSGQVVFDLRCSTRNSDVGFGGEFTSPRVTRGARHRSTVLESLFLGFAVFSFCHF